MKHITLLAITTILLMLITCSTPPEIKKALLDAQQIMTEDPQSAYTILKGINADDLAQSKDRALFALLWTQAQDKCYEPFTSDTLINVAVNYFKKGSDKTHYARSLFYLGRYEASIDSVQCAIKTLKQAELIATNPNDLALINFDIGKLYEKQDLFEPAIERYKASSDFFAKADNLTNLGLVYGRIAFVYQLEKNRDSSLCYFDKATELAIQGGDTTEIISALVFMNTAKAKFSDDRNSARQNFFEIFDKYNFGIIPNNFKGHLLSVYYNCNQLDSARSVALDILDTNHSDQIGIILYLSKIEEKAGDYRKALKHHTKYNQLVDSLWQSRLDNYVSKFEKKYDNARLININDNLRNSQTFWILMSIILIFSVVAIYFIFRSRMLRRKNEMNSAQIFINDLQSKVNQHASYSDLIHQSTGTILKLIRLSYEFQGNKEAFYKKFVEIMSVKDNQKEVIKLISDSISTQRPKLFRSIAARYPALTEDEVTFMGFILFGVTNEALCMLYQIEYHSVVVKWSRLRKKLSISNNKDVILSDLDKAE